MQNHFIDGVLVHRETTEGLFHYTHYPLPKTALQPGRSSICIPYLDHILALRIFYTCIPSSLETTRDLALSKEYFFGYWSFPDERKYTADPAMESMVIYRDDYKPLHPKQIEALYSFCCNLLYTLTPPIVLEYEHVNNHGKAALRLWFDYMFPSFRDTPDERFEEFSVTLNELWNGYFTVNNFNAFFEKYRYERLLEGFEEWRVVKPL